MSVFCFYGPPRRVARPGRHFFFKKKKTMFPYWRGIMCKYMYIHAYIKTRTLETMRQRRPKSIKTITNQNLNWRKRAHTHGHAHSASQPSHPISVAHKKTKKSGVPCNHQLFSRAGLPWRGAGAGASSIQTPLAVLR